MKLRSKFSWVRGKERLPKLPSSLCWSSIDRVPAAARSLRQPSGAIAIRGTPESTDYACSGSGAGSHRPLVKIENTGEQEGIGTSRICSPNMLKHSHPLSGVAYTAWRARTREITRASRFCLFEHAFTASARATKTPRGG